MAAQGNSTFKGNRVAASHAEIIKRSPGKIFPLLCPVQEYNWIDQWDCEIIFSNREGIENNCIFKEYQSGPVLFDSDVPTYWIVSTYDITNRRIQFVLMSDLVAISKIEVEVKKMGDGKSSVSWSMVITGICEEGNKHIGKSTRNKAKLYLTVLGKALKHYCEKGEKLTLNKTSLLKMGVSAGVLGFIKNHIKGLSSK